MDKNRLSKDNPKDRSQYSPASHKEILNTLNKNDLKFLHVFIEHLKHEHNLNSDQVIEALSRQQRISEVVIPISVFNTNTLSCLEIVVKYLRENLYLTPSKIADVLSRDQRTIWTTYNNSKEKNPNPLDISSSKFYIPISIFSDRRFSALEALVFYLFDKLSLKIVEISVLLKKDHSTIWTTLSRARKKRGETK